VRKACDSELDAWQHRFGDIARAMAFELRIRHVFGGFLMVVGLGRAKALHARSVWRLDLDEERKMQKSAGQLGGCPALVLEVRRASWRRR
jgi:hypothetical protein